MTNGNGKANGNGHGIVIKVALVVVSLVAGAVLTSWLEDVNDTANSARIAAQEARIERMNIDMVRRFAVIETQLDRVIEDVAGLDRLIRQRDP